MKHFFTGLGFGVVAGMLLAPKRGDLIRIDVRNRAQRVLGTISDAIAVRLKTASRKSPSSLAAQKAENSKATDAEILNTATREALIAVHGIGNVLADKIIENRPYKTADEVVERGILPESTFVQLRRELLDEKSA